MTTYGSGNIISTQAAPGLYTVKQPAGGSNLPNADHLAKIGVDLSSHHGIDYSFGPITITGYVDTSNLGVGVEAKLFGISLGTFYGDLKQGLGIKIDVIAAKGEVKLELDANAVWVTVTLTPRWGQGINIHDKLFNLPGKESQEGGNPQGLKN